jgi:hypothetical protein
MKKATLLLISLLFLVGSGLGQSQLPKPPAGGQSCRAQLQADLQACGQASPNFIDACRLRAFERYKACLAQRRNGN